MNAAVTALAAASRRCCSCCTSRSSRACRGATSRGVRLADDRGHRPSRRSGGSCRCSCTRATASTSCASPSRSGSIWGTTSLSESLRLMGYWPSYLGVGYGDDAAALLRRLGHAAVRARRGRRDAARAGAGARRLRVDAALALRAVLPAARARRAARDDASASPRARRCARAANFTYNNFAAGPVPAHHLQGGAARRRSRSPCLGGAAFGRGVAAARAAGGRAARARLSPARALVALAALAAASRAARSTPRSTWDRIPRAWTDAAARPRPRAAAAEPRRSCCPASRSRSTAGARRSTRSCRRSPSGRSRCATCRRTPTCTRSTCSGPSTSMVQQQRLMPGQLPPLLDLLGARAVITATDDDFERSGAIPPAEAGDRAGRARGSAGPGALVRRRCGGFAPPRGTLDPRGDAARRCGATTCRARARSCASSRPAAAIVVDGSAERRRRRWRRSGALPARRPLRYAGDLDDGELRDAAARRRVESSSATRTAGACSSRRARASRRAATLGADEEFSEDAAVLDPFPERGSDAPDGRGLPRRTRTCARRSRRRSRSSPSSGRSRRSTATRARLARRTRRSTTRATGSRSGSTGRATCRTSTCCPTTTRA